MRFSLHLYHHPTENCDNFADNLLLMVNRFTRKLPTEAILKRCFDGASFWCLDWRHDHFWCRLNIDFSPLLLWLSGCTGRGSIHRSCSIPDLFERRPLDQVANERLDHHAPVLALPELVHQLCDLSVRQQPVGLQRLGHSRHIVEENVGLSGGHASLDEVPEVSVGNDLRSASNWYAMEGAKQQGGLDGGDVKRCYTQVNDGPASIYDRNKPACF